VTGGRRSRAAAARRRALLGLALAALAAGCGYSLRGTLPPHLRTVAIPVFANQTAEPAVEGIITRAVVEAFSTNGRLRVVRREDADALLEGDVVGYDVSAIAFDPAANITQYRLTVTLNLRLRDLRRNAVVFEQAGVQDRADFRVTGAVAQTIAREETALREAAVAIARTVVSLAVERF
jgi:outer membrane lipopolysaccharide assembly protein LptE/RlpB